MSDHALEIDLSKVRKPTAFWLLSDVHMGSTAYDNVLFAKHKKRVKEAGAYVFSLGDMLECVTPDSKVARMGGMWEQDMTIPEQRKLFESEMQGLEVLTVLDGNHEERAWRFIGESPLEISAMILDGRQKNRCHYLGIGGFVKLQLGDIDYVFHLHHGEGAPTQYFDRLLRSRPGADVYAGGHNHALLHDRRSVLTPDGAHDVHWVRTGSYINRPRYAAKKMHTNAEPALGSFLMWLNPKRKEIEFETLT